MRPMIKYTIHRQDKTFKRDVMSQDKFITRIKKTSISPEEQIEQLKQGKEVTFHFDDSSTIDAQVL